MSLRAILPDTFPDRAGSPSDRNGFEFSRRPRAIESASARPFRWPTKAGVANAYVDLWMAMASRELSALRLSRATLKAVASHVSRRDGACRLTDKALAARSGRSVASTKRDVQRLKRLGFLIAEYEGGDSRQERVRLLRLAIPDTLRSSQRIPPAGMAEVVSTYPPYVDPLDMGERRNV